MGNFWKRVLSIGAAFAMALSLLAGAALAESGRGDLSERFSNVPQIEYDGETYYVRDRMSLVLATGILGDESDGLPHTDFAMVIVIDDNEKRITPIYIEGQTIVELDGVSMPLRDIFAQGTDYEESILRLKDAVNGLLDFELLEDYMAVDLDGITVIKLFSGVEGNTRERLHLLRIILQSIPSKQLNEMYGEISEYLVTNMKSGAVMRVIDKSDRYEVVETVDLPVFPSEAEDGPLTPDAERIRDLIVSVCYETKLF